MKADVKKPVIRNKPSVDTESTATASAEPEETPKEISANDVDANTKPSVDVDIPRVPNGTTISVFSTKRGDLDVSPYAVIRDQNDKKQRIPLRQMVDGNTGEKVVVFDADLHDGMFTIEIELNLKNAVQTLRKFFSVGQ